MAPESEADPIDVLQKSSDSEAARPESVPNIRGDDKPPYARFTVQLVSSSLLAAVSVFAIADSTTRNQWDTMPLALLCFAVAAILALGARSTWLRIAAVREEGDTVTNRRRVIVTSSVVVVGLLTGGAILGRTIGQNRTEAAQLNADLRRLTDVGARISKARNAAGSTIDSYVRMYEAIEPDVKELETTLRRLKTELSLYDTKFPAQHDDTSKSIAGMETGLQRVTLLKQQIEVAKNIDRLQAFQKADTWRMQMLPLLAHEEDLDKAK
jgi:hypothetical protein